MAYTLPEQHRRTADRIPAAIKSQLTTAEVLARCEEHDRLLKVAGSFADASGARLYFELSTRLLQALPADELARRVAGMQKTADSIAVATQRAAFYQQISELQSDNPQVSAEQLAAAERLVDAMTGTRHVAGPVSVRQTGPNRREYVREPPTLTRSVPTEAPDMLYKRG